MTKMDLHLLSPLRRFYGNSEINMHNANLIFDENIGVFKTYEISAIFCERTDDLITILDLKLLTDGKPFQ